MPRSKAFSSVRARFAATVVTVVALVALGGVTPAVAADVNVTVTVTDAAQGGIYPNRPIVLEASNGTTYSFTTNSSAQFFTGTVGPIPEGSYRLVPGGQYVPTPYFTFVAGQTTASIAITKPKIAGSIPSAAGSGHTTVRVEIQGSFPSGTTYFAEVSNFVVTNADGSFAHLLQTGTGTYRLKFEPDASAPYFDTYSDPITVDGTIDTVSVGAVALTPAGFISGTVTTTPGGSAVSGATVSAYSGATLVTSATTASDGSYLLKLAATNASLTITAASSGFTAGSYAGNPVALTAGNSYTASSIDLALERLPINLTGTTVGGGGDPYAVDTFLYKKDGTGKFAQTPYGTAPNSTSFSFTDLPDGDYRIAFRSRDTERTLIWNSLTDNGSPQYAPTSEGLCYYAFTMSAGSGSRVLGSVSLAEEQRYPASCDTPAYADGSDASVTGSVLNYDDMTYIVFAKLYKAGPSGGTVVDTSQLEADGSFTLSGVREAGSYYIKIVPYEDEAYLPTLLGAGGETAWARDLQAEVDFSADHAFAVDPATSTGLTGHDVTLTAGALLDGYIQSESGGWINAGLVITDVTDSSNSLYVPLNYYGGFSVVLPVGGSYTLLATSVDGDYTEEYWEGATSSADAETVGPLTAGAFGTYPFTLSPTPPALFGFVSDVAQITPLTVHLFHKDAYGLWQAVGTQESSFEQVHFTDLDEGDYRMRFERNGVWFSAESYRIGTLPDGNTPLTTVPSCFVDIENVGAGFPSFIEATIDSDMPSLACAAEPATRGDVTGHVISSVATGSVDVGGAAVYLQNNNTFEFVETVTDANGEFTFADVRNGDYTLAAYSTGPHVNGTHDYYFAAGYTITGGLELGDVVALRLGNVTGTIGNWDDATMSGATATVYSYCTCDSSWHEASADVGIDSDGHFELPAIGEDGQYSVFIDFEHSYVDTFIGGGSGTPTAPFTGVAEMDYSYPPITLDLVEMVTITGTAFYGTFPLEGAEIYAETADDYFYAEVDEDGNYELEVPPNADYLLSAYYEPLMVQYYDGVNYELDDQGPWTGTTVPVGTSAIAGINFSLIASQTDHFQVYTQADEGFGPYSLFDVDVHLYKYVVDGWVEVDSYASAPYADLYSSDGGDYRLRFSKDGEWLRVDQTSWENDLPPFDSTDGTVGVDACYIDFDDVDHGSEFWVEATLDADGANSGCGPEVLAEHREVVGATVRTDGFANSAVAGQTVTLTNTTTGYVFTRTTDAAGTFSFTGVSDGVYTLDVPSMVGTDGYAYVATGQVVTVSADVALDPIELTRIGTVELDIENWDPAMAGAVAQLLFEDPVSVWTPIASDTVDGSGEFMLPGVTETGNYRVWVDYPSGFVDGYASDYYDPTATLEAALVAENDEQLSTLAFTTVSGSVRLGADPVGSAAVSIEAWSGGWVFPATTGVDGSFSIAVPAGGTYTVESTKAGLVRGLITTVPVANSPESGLLLDMHYATFLSAVFDGPLTTLPSATVHLYRQVSGGWQEVATDSGAMTYLATNVGGSYRIRVSDGADWMAIGSYEWSNDAYPAENSGGTTSPVPNVCVLDFTPASAGAEYEVNIEVNAASAVSCGAEPAVYVPPVTPAKPAFVPRPGAADSDTTGAATEVEEGTPSEDTTDAEEGNEPPSTGDGDDTAGGSDTGTDDSAPSTFELPWAIWLVILLVLLLLIGGGVLLARRRA